MRMLRNRSPKLVRFGLGLRRPNLGFTSFGCKNSFTLIELLIVIGILAILTAAVVILLNPAEMLKKGRDGTRMQDIASLDTTISLLETQVSNLDLGIAQTLYISIPDPSLSGSSTSTCSSLGLPTLPSGYTYHCVSQDNLRNVDGTGWLPVDFTQSGITSLPALPIDPTNSTSTGLFYRYIPGGSYHLEALLESNSYLATAQSDGGSSPSAFEKGSNLTLMPPTFPTGYVKVPGNSTFGTSDFYVMQYEAKCFDENNQPLPYTTGDGGEGATYNIYRDLSFPCTSANNKYVGSAPTGAPITRVSQTNAIARCEASGAHLITNNEWQTIAWNIQNNAVNWSGGSVGSGTVPRGNSNTSAAMSDASTLSGVNYRKHILSNGNEVWDMAGNVWDWTSDTIVGTNKPAGTAGSWVEFTAVSNYGTLSRSQFGPVDSSWSATQGLGRYYMGTADGTTYAFLRGGDWGDSTNAGVETLYLTYTPGYTEKLHRVPLREVVV
ncbi:hypothetical protein A2935_02040 [Candidatus Wolfebacteria bacterium RIFCSPLOWO2_01_FULL_47_17b]|uniref:Sulfatase-modifying factor enzyme-like domain-containing protein n=1 Tax=Candidatus Wolfebacteria bacterium RIFCSPLOWO2_01_FULL_47_17b TaxID=1802558 RepID=A0A1F8DU01_9BACT|nr:MAG: hypothetical protein A2935_02040 [Candidatus Wolfebacteria bacterium RIFCSPLOWO2_01_FULL_47_17b]